MIRPFERLDLRRFVKPNEHSGVRDMNFIFYDDNVSKFSLIGEDGNVYAFICFYAYWQRNYAAFFLVSEYISPRQAVELKNFVWDAVKDLNANRVQTESQACDALDRWHKFLGFFCEGTSEKMIYNKDYRRWAILRGRDF